MHVGLSAFCVGLRAEIVSQCGAGRVCLAQGSEKKFQQGDQIAMKTGGCEAFFACRRWWRGSEHGQKVMDVS